MSLLNVQAEFVEALSSTDYQTDVLTPISHLSIYRNTVSSSLINTLKTTYPLILALLGDEFFVMTAKEYMRQYPSRSGNLYDYGEYFSDFLTSYQPVHDLIYLAEVAEFEWASHVLYLAPNHTPFASQSLEHFSPDQQADLRFLLHPACWMRKFHFPILEIVDLCKSHRIDNIDIHGNGVNLLIIRREFDLVLLPLDQADYTFLQALNLNCTLAEALQAAEKIDAAYPLAEKLPAFFQNKVLVDCYLSEKGSC
jgi:hypothetical protein